MYIEDKIDVSKLTSRKITDEGYLTAQAVFTKVGVQQYDLSSLTGNLKDSGKVVGVYRSPEVVFNDNTIESIKQKPITLQHPSEQVRSENYRMYSVGTTGENIQKVNDNMLSGTIRIFDKNVVKEVQDNKIKEISLGYNSKFIKKSGEYNGEKYEYEFQDSMSVNHCAIVDKGRCGSEVSILDSKDEGEKVNKEVEKENNEVIQESSNDDKKVVNDVSVKDNNSDKKDSKATDKCAESKMIIDSKELEQMILDKANEIAIKRSTAMNVGQIFLGDSVDFSSMSDRQIIESAYKKALNDSSDLSKKSDDFIMGALSIARNNKLHADTQHATISDSINSTSIQDAKYFSAIECQAMRKRGVKNVI